MTTPHRNARNMQSTFDALAASAERRRAKMSPEERKVVQAGALTPAEEAELNALYASVAEAQGAMTSLGLRRLELEADTHADEVEWTSSGGVFSRLFTRPPDPGRAAAARVELDDYPLKEQVARNTLQLRVREQNVAEHRIATARAKRRHDAEAKVNPPLGHGGG